LVTMQRNLHDQGMTLGWDFLGFSTGSTLSFSLIDYDINSTFARALLVGFLNTIFLGSMTVSLSVLFGTVLGIILVGRNRMLVFMAQLYVQIFRNLPLILQAYFWYALVTHLPNPRQAISVFDSIFISGRGIFLPIVNVAPLSLVAAGLVVVSGSITIFLFLRAGKSRQAFLAISICLFMIALLLYHGRQVGTDFITFPRLAGLRFTGGFVLVPELLAAVIAITLFGSAYIAEIVRAGIQATPKGQIEAARSIALRPRFILRYVVLPQALRVIVPPLTSQYVSLIKNSSIAVVVGYPDLVNIGNTVMNQTGQAVEAISIMLLIYLLISIVTSLLMNFYNRLVAIKE